MKEKKELSSIRGKINTLEDSILDEMQDFSISMGKLIEKYESFWGRMIDHILDETSNIFKRIKIEEKNGKVIKVVVDGKEYVKKEK